MRNPHGNPRAPRGCGARRGARSRPRCADRESAIHGNRSAELGRTPGGRDGLAHVGRTTRTRPGSFPPSPETPRSPGRESPRRLAPVGRRPGGASRGPGLRRPASHTRRMVRSGTRPLAANAFAASTKSRGSPRPQPGRRRGIGEAVAQHHGARARAPAGYDLLDELRAGRLEDEQLGFVAHLGVGRIQHHSAQRSPTSVPPGSRRHTTSRPMREQRLGQKADMGGLAGAVAALERDEHAALGRLLCGKPLIGGLRGSSRVHRGARSRTALAHHRHLAHDARVADIGHVAIPARRRPRRQPRLPRRAGRTARA